MVRQTPSARSLRRRRRFASILFCAALLSCAPPAQQAPEVAETEPAAPAEIAPRSVEEWRAELLACPDDRVWTEAIDDASKNDELPDLDKTGEEAAETCSGRWEPHWARGQALYAGDRYAPQEVFDRMATHWRAANAMAEAADAPAGTARASTGMAIYFLQKGDLAAAERSARAAIEAAVAARRVDLEADGNNWLAGSLRAQGRLAEALDALEIAEKFYQAWGDESSAVAKGLNRAVLLEDVGQLARGEELAARLYAAAVRLGEADHADKASVLMGNLLLLRHEYDESRKWFDRVRPDHAQRHNAALGLGRIALRQGRYDEALSRLDVALESTKPPFRLWARRVRARVLMLSGDLEAAVAESTQVAEDARGMGTSETEAAALTLLGQCRLRQGRGKEALAAMRRAVELIEGSGAGLDPAVSRTYLRERYEPYVELAAMLTDRDASTADEVLAVIESAHARALRQLLGSMGRAPLQVASVRELQSRLRSRDVLVDYLVGEDRGVLVAVTPADVRVQKIPGWRTLREPLRRYRAALTRPLVSAEARMDPMRDLERDLPLGRELRVWLLGGVEDLLDDADRLYVVPDQDLSLLPFAALPGPKRGFLGDELEVANLPLASIGSTERRDRGPLLLAGDPVGNEGDEFAPLPMAAAELDAIATVWRGVETVRLEKGELTATRFRELPLDEFGTLHLATHAIASSRDPRRCAVILSHGDRLGIQEIADVQLDAGLVVLSACRTGGGEIVPGEGVIGLTWALLSAGAREIVASLWTIEDAATKYLMIAFHESLRAGADSVTALNRAQTVTRSARPHPVYWAPFVVVISPADD